MDIKIEKVLVCETGEVSPLRLSRDAEGLWIEQDEDRILVDTGDVNAFVKALNDYVIEEGM